MRIRCPHCGAVRVLKGSEVESCKNKKVACSRKCQKILTAKGIKTVNLHLIRTHRKEREKLEKLYNGRCDI